MIKPIIFSIVAVSFFFFTFTVSAQVREFKTSVCTKVGNPTESCDTPVGNGGCWPTSGSLTQGPLGKFDHAGIKSRRDADAVDIAGQGDTKVFATFNGTALTAYGDNGGFGNMVTITSSDREYKAIYAHLSAIITPNGPITVGDQIGIQGTTGISTGIHLHWELQGIPLAPPLIPEPIKPLDCEGSCSPKQVSFDINQCNADTQTSTGSYKDKLLQEFKITMNGFDEQHLKWAYDKMKEVSNTRFPNMVQGAVIQMKPRTPDDPYSEQVGCPGRSAVNIKLIQQQDDPQEEIFKITFTHELGHVIQLCSSGAKAFGTGLSHESVFAEERGITYYAQNAGEPGTGCPGSGSDRERNKRNEDYADMITYFLNPTSTTKNVCGNGRDPNPITSGEYPQHSELVKQILGSYP